MKGLEWLRILSLYWIITYCTALSWHFPTDSFLLPPPSSPVVGVVPWSDIHCVLMTFERLADVIKLSPSAHHWQWNSGTFRGCVSNCHCAVKACTVELLSPHAWWRWRCCLNSTFHNRSMLKKLWSHHQQLALRPPLNTLPFSTSSSASPSPLFILTSSSILHFSLLCVKMLIYYEWLLCQWLFIKSDSVYNNY